MLKRIIAHIINRLIIFIPSLLLLGGIAYLINPDYFIFDNGVNTGWDIFYLYKYMLFLPLVFKDIISNPAGEFLYTMKLVGPALLCVITVESISIALLKRHIGMKIIGLTLVSLKDSQVSLVQILVRTLLKYFTLAFFPIALIYIFFNKERMTVHDQISSTKVVFTPSMSKFHI